MSPTTFSPRVSDWFADAFATPTQAQEQAWPAIATGEHVLISAPTGSGKTLAAFLWALDRLTAEPLPEGERRTRLVYVSPLKALSYDIERNLRAPLRGIEAGLGEDAPRVRVALRTGDTPQSERQRMLRNPPDILITTPESLYLMLTSRAREILGGVEWIILDEIHAVAASKRGAHMALTLERLDALAGRDVQRIGLSATQKPLEEVARFMVGPTRKCRIVDTGIRKPLDLRIHVPVESMSEPDLDPTSPELDPLAGGEPTRRSIWPAMYPELLALIREHRSTIVFVNNRRSAERLALRLNELAQQDDEEEERGPRTAPSGEVVRAPGGDSAPPREIARAHHGSLAREERLLVEEQLKAGAIPCIVATSSLELGIDMGAVDLVIQVESPKSVAAGLQRIGRAGHNVGDVSKGRIFPKFRADLLECAVVAKRMREGAIEQTVVPRNPLDVLAQQIVAMAAAEGGDDGGGGHGTGSYGWSGDGGGGDGRGSDGGDDRGGCGESAGAGLSVDDLHARVTRTYTYAELSRAQLENVLDMLDGRYPSSEFAELRPRIVWDRLGGVIRPRKAARALAVANAGTIPDRGLYLVTLPDGRRVGELDEEMVYEARPGQVFLLGASSWRIEEIGRDRVIVTPAPGVPGAIPFWKGDGIGRPKELGEAIGAFSRWAVQQEPEALERDYDLDRRAAANLIELLREQQAVTGVLPSDHTIVIERFRDEIGDWRAPATQIPAVVGVERLREQLVPLQGLALTPEVWERDVLPLRLGGYSPAWLDTLCASGEIVWLGAGALGRTSGRVALYFREDASLLAAPPVSSRVSGSSSPVPSQVSGFSSSPAHAPSIPSPGAESPAPALAAGHDAQTEHEALRARLHAGSAFFSDLLGDLDFPAQALQEALWDLVWAGEVTNDAFAPLRTPRLALAKQPQPAPRRTRGGRFSTRRSAQAGRVAQLPGRWSLTTSLFATHAPADPSARRRALAELLLERYGILTREQVLAEGVPGGFAALYPHLTELETLGLARRGYFVEGLGGAQFALPSAVERLRSRPREEPPSGLVLAATDPAQPYGASLAWPARPGGPPLTGPSPSPHHPAPTRSTRRPARAAGAYVVLVDALAVLYLERGGRAMQVLLPAQDPRVSVALGALAEHVRSSGQRRRLALERIDGEPVLGSSWEGALAAVGFHAGSRRLTLSA